MEQQDVGYKHTALLIPSIQIAGPNAELGEPNIAKLL
jgi:hypothetical protein